MSRLTQLLLLALSASSYVLGASNKRGLIHIPSSAHPEDDRIWLMTKTNGNGMKGLPDRVNLKWYYNYQVQPSQSIPAKRTGAGQEDKPVFVPMLWGDYQNNFVEDVRRLRREGYVIDSVLGYNEPDMPNSVGGSGMTPARAAELWRRDIEPLSRDGIKLGAPGIAGTEDGKRWLAEFFRLCSGCTIDFIPLHWYGDFQGLASHLGHLRSMYPTKPLWLTEYGFAHQNLADTQWYAQATNEYLDRLDYMDRYSWFGAFRSDVSNVGPNGAMLNERGLLTDIGSWYLGGEGNTGVVPRG